jgi:hypothetical protein
MPWQSSRTFRPIERHHYQAKCSDCPVDAEVCVKRMPAGEDAEQVAHARRLARGWDRRLRQEAPGQREVVVPGVREG